MWGEGVTYRDPSSGTSNGSKSAARFPQAHLIQTLGLYVIADFQIHLATRWDATAIAEMSKADIEYGLPWGWTPRRVSKAMKNPATNDAVVRKQGVLVAFGIM